MKTKFPHIQRAAAAMSKRDRAVLARAFDESTQPILKALAAELRAANAQDDAEISKLDYELARQHVAEMAAIEAYLPAPGAIREEGDRK